MILHRRPLADRGSPGRTNGNAVINPRIRVCSTVVLRSCLQPRATALWCLRSVSVNGGMPAPSVIDNEHQSSCATTGSRTVSSSPTRTYSITAVMHGTDLSISLGPSCPSGCASGHIGSDRWASVLGIALSTNRKNRVLRARATNDSCETPNPEQTFHIATAGIPICSGVPTVTATA